MRQLLNRVQTSSKSAALNNERNSTPMRRIVYLCFLLVLAANALCQQQQHRSPTVTDKLAWWSAARFGLFIHWGLYAQTAGDWNGRPTRGGEHFMLYEKIPLHRYAQIAKDFEPTCFDADSWVKAAKDAGMKYIVITAKHHDGFAMFRSPSSDYNIVQQTPWQRDPMQDLAAACKKYDMKLGFYYSLGRDWADPDVPTNWPTRGGRSNSWDYPDEDAKDLTKYIARKVKPQLRELLTQYGPIGLIWFDTPELFSKRQSEDIRRFINDLQPQCIVNSRIGNNLGDYTVVEQSLVSKATENWEACITMSANWGYNRHDTIWKSPEILVRNLVEVVSKGGNLLLNVGPKGDGTFPPESIARLRSIGDWMAMNGEAIYGSRTWKVSGEGNLLIGEQEQLLTGQTAGKQVDDKMDIKDAVNDATSKEVVPDIRFTAKDNCVYVFIRSPNTRFAMIKSLAAGQAKIDKISLLGSRENIPWTQHAAALQVPIPQTNNGNIPVYVYKVALVN